MDFFKGLFGFSSTKQQSEYPPNSNFDEKDFRKEMRTYEFSDDEIPRQAFDVFTDPIQMHQYFEQQVNQVLKNFGFTGIDAFTQFNIPAIEVDPNFIDGQSHKAADLREQFLKKGYEKPSHHSTVTEKTDKDIDEELKISSFDSIVDKSSQGKNRLKPWNENHQSGKFFFGQSITSKTVRNPDGSVETHRTVRDNEGNEETTICRKLGDKEYCILKKRDKNGKEETTETMVNINENDKFLNSQGFPQLDEKPHNFFPFDRFFK